mgnify:CR=1 FL=1
MTTSRQAFGATYARSYYHLGLIAVRQGDRSRAREQFQKFLDLWEGADKDLPEVADARKRMAPSLAVPPSFSRRPLTMIADLFSIAARVGPAVYGITAMSPGRAASTVRRMRSNSGK